MAVVINFKIEETDNTRALIFKETTGAYDAVLNTDGWGAPNETTGDAVTTTLTITQPGEDTGTAYTSTEIAGLASFPTTDTGLELEIDGLALGLGQDAEIPDGVWTFEYEIVTGTATYTATHKVFVSGQVRCCVYGLLADVDTVDCDCDASEKLAALEAYTFYRALIANASCGNEDKYNDLLTLTDKLCEKCKCGCS